MAEPLMNVDQAFDDIAGVNPPCEVTQQALARARAAVEAANAPRRHWLWAASIAAILIVVVGVALPLLLPRQASAQDALAATLKATAAYRGWVHMTFGNKPWADWNTVTGDILERWRSSPGDVRLVKPANGEAFVYLVATNTLYRGSLEPGMGRRLQDSAQSMPLNFEALVDNIHAVAGQPNVHVTQSSDRGMDRFDIATPPVSRQAAQSLWMNAEWMNPYLPSTVWVDPGTKLVREMLVKGATITLSYGAPEFGSVYDAGAPRDARIVDNRATPKALAAYDRVMSRAAKDFPDGLLACLHQWKGVSRHTPLELAVYFRSGTQWTIRYYPVTLGNAENGKVQWPDDPKDAPDILRRLAQTLPIWEQGSDGQTAWIRYYDPGSGAIFHSERVQISSNSFSVETRPGEQFIDADRASSALEASFMHMRIFSPRLAIQALTVPTYKFELITSNDRPSLAAFRVQDVRTATVNEEWFDPSHEDRVVEFVTTNYTDSRLREIHRRSVEQFGDYSQLPDGRSFPTTWRSTYYEPDAEGRLAEGNLPEGLFYPGRPAPGVATLRFFPGAKLPALPKRD